MTKMIDIEEADGSGSFPAYVAEPAGAPKAAVIVIQEIFGVNTGMRRRCDVQAEAGYLAIAPDLFWRIAPGVQLDPDVEPEFKQALELMGQFDQDQGVRDIEATVKTARMMLGGSGKVGAVGYCLGGRLAFMTAARTDIDAAVGYYGVGIDGLLGEKDKISRPVLLHIAKNDHFVGPDAQARMHEGLDGVAHVTLQDYEGVDHGFATEFGTRRSEAAAVLADQRTAAFFAEHLK